MSAKPKSPPPPKVRRERVDWSKVELETVVAAFLDLRLRAPLEPAAPLIHQAEDSVLEPPRRRHANAFVAYGSAFAEEWERQHGLFVQRLGSGTWSSPPVTAASPVEKELLPILIEVQVPVIKEVVRYADPHQVLESMPGPLLLGYAISKMMGGNGHSPLPSPAAAPSNGSHPVTPQKAVERATAPLPPPPTPTKRKVLCVGIYSDAVEEVMPKLGNFGNVEVSFIDQRNWTENRVACDYVLLCKSIGTRHPMTDQFYKALPHNHVLFVEGRAQEVMRKLADLNSLQVTASAQ